MGVYKNKSTNRWEWIERIDGVQVRRRSKKWTKKSQAQEHMDQFILEYELSQEQDDGNPFFIEVVESYLENLELSKKQSSILRTTQTMNRHIVPFFKKHKVTAIDTKLIQSWQRELLKKRVRDKADGDLLRNKYLENIQVTLRSILKFAQSYGCIRLNPLEMIPFAFRREYEEKKKMTILTKEQFNTFMALVEDPIEIAMYHILYWCGPRIGELLGLRMSDYSREDKTLHIRMNFDYKNNLMTHTKNELERIIDVPDICIAAIDNAIATYPAPIKGNYALTGYHNNLRKSTIDNRKIKYWDTLHPEAGDYIKEHKILRVDYEGDTIVPWFTFHELRHTHVSTLIELGWEAKDISERLGHSVHEVNETYGHLFPKRKREMFDKLNNFAE